MAQSGSGGALHYTCDKVTGLNCFLNITSGTIFSYNHAVLQGGAIHWDEKEPSFGFNITYFKNSAGEYGDNISCYAQELVMVSTAKYQD